MTTVTTPSSAVSTAPPDGRNVAPSRSTIAAVADNLVQIMHSFGKARARLLATAAHDVEWSAHVVLRVVQTDGPMRSSAIADWLRSDPSTISRQVASLVKDGLLERRADPQDGRASLLAVTAKGEDVLADHKRIRVDYFAYLLDDWDDTELADFAAKLARFGEAYDAAMDDDDLRQRITDAAGTTLRSAH